MIKRNIAFRYVLDHDLGFAPNPFFNYLTLAGCKPVLNGKKGIRKSVTKDILENYNVWIFANGGSELFLENYEYKNDELVKLDPNWRTQNRLVYAFQVNEVLTFEEYYNDPRFSLKKRINSGSNIRFVGDNILHSPTWNSEHNVKQYLMDPELEKIDSISSKRKPPRKKNILVENVLISKKNQFYYFGCFAPNILTDLQRYFKKGPGYKKEDNEDILTVILSRLKEVCSKSGIFGFPSFKKSPKKNIEFSKNKNYLCEIYRDYFDKNTKIMIRRWKAQVKNKDEFINPTINLLDCI